MNGLYSVDEITTFVFTLKCLMLVFNNISAYLKC